MSSLLYIDFIRSIVRSYPALFSRMRQQDLHALWMAQQSGEPVFLWLQEAEKPVDSTLAP